MGQQPNIKLELSDLPRPTAHTAPARGWSPRRPGELNSPEAVPWGGMFGATGPDAGYVLSLLARTEIVLEVGEKRKNVDAALAAVASARASHYGRAPIQQDLDTALLVFGYRSEGLPSELISGLATERVAWFSHLVHDPVRAGQLVADIPLTVLASGPEEIRARMVGGERLIRR